MKEIVEHSIVNIKEKMTEIRRNKTGMIYRNYYGNCDSCTEIFTIYGNNSVVFWFNDNGILRGYFYSSNLEELRILLKRLPTGCIIDYLTKEKDEFLDFLAGSGLTFLYEMHRMSLGLLTEDENKEIQRKKELLKKAIYMPQNVRRAEPDDLEEIYNKLYEIFDPRESHLPTKEELLSIIKNGWAGVYCEEERILGIQIFKVVGGAYYGYQGWNAAGPEGYFSLMIYCEQLYEQYMQTYRKIVRTPGYCWVNVKNRKSKRLIEYWGQKADGLYDFIYEKNIM